MSDVIAYPTEDMKRTAREIRTILDTQWSKHVSNYSTFTELLGAIAGGLPAAKRQEAQHEAEQWQQKMQKQYTALYDLADALEKGSITMDETDQDVSKTFHHHANLS